MNINGCKMKLEAIEINSNSIKWTTLIILEITIGICSFILPFKIVLILLLLIPAVFLIMSNYLYAYLLGIFLLPIWSITLAGHAEVAGQVDLRFSDACFLIAGLSWLASGMSKKRVEVKGSGLDWYLFAFALWILLSTLWSPIFLLGAKEFLRKLNGLFIFYLTINIINNPKDLDLTLMAWIISGVTSAFFALYGVLTGVMQRITGISKAAIARWGWMRATALKEGANRLGFLLNTCLMLSISKFVLGRRSRNRILLFILITAMFFTLISTLSRNSVMGFIVGSTFLFLIIKKGRTKFFIMAVALILLFLLMSGPGYREIFFRRYAGLLSPQETTSIEGRTVIWQAVFKMIRDHPFFGSGAGGVHVLSELYGAERLKSPHNLYIYVIGEFGLIGFLLFMGIVLAFLRLMKHGLQSAPGEKEKFILAALLAGVIIYGFQGLVVNFVLIEREFWVLLGLNVAAVRIYCQEKQDNYS